MTAGDRSDEAAPQPATDLGSIFLGPKGENAEVFERLLLDAFRDHVFWRRNFHPEDGFLVQEVEKQSQGYERSISVLRQELLGLLAELKAGVPFFSPRYAGHMCSDLTMASLVGYFATMLYNPNNVAAEASPVTSRLELEVADQLAAMIGYDVARHWGHLTSGGTVANFEALWVARNVKYLGVAIHWAAAEGAHAVPVALPDGSEADIGDLDLWRLLNLTPNAALNALDQFRALFEAPEDALDILTRHSLAGLGYQEFGRRLEREFGDALPPSVVLVPSTAHYSWEKICRSLGLGSANLVHVPVDDRFRMDPDALADALSGLAERRQPVSACIAVMGTTEESAVDRLDRIVEVRADAARRLGIAFHLHADAAYGGYAASVTRRSGGARRPYAEAVANRADVAWPQEEVFRALVALEDTDSVTIDPHKLGFLPYPAGAICFRDRRARELVSVDAPYVFHRGASEWGYIGRYIFEGSKPGAAAAAVWLSHKVLPLDATGYGHLIGATASGALILHRSLRSADWEPFRLVPLPAPDLNIVCFTIGHPDLSTLEANNEFIARIYRAMSVGESPDRQPAPDYFVTKTILGAHAYGRSAIPLVEALGFTEEDYFSAGGLAVIRCTVMDPFLAAGRGRVDHIESFLKSLRRVMEESL
ncbi:MAG: pyridoxal-dependent decarboxylase [Gemmatimonadota bacterium]